MTSDLRQLARLYDQQLRIAASAFSIELFGRKKTAAAQDELFFALIGQLIPQFFVEVGAFGAEASQRVARKVPECSVIAFEASPENYREIVEAGRVAAAGVDYRHAAVSDRPGTVDLWINESNTLGHRGNNSLRETNDSTVSRHSVEVMCTTLDASLPEAEGVIALWVDVEGLVLEVFRGAQAVLPHVDLIKVEVEDKSNWQGQSVAIDVIEELLGYGLVPVTRDVEYDGQYNILFASERLLTDGLALSLVEKYLYAAQHSLHHSPNAIRANPALRKVLSPLRRNVGRLKDLVQGPRW